MTDEAMVEEEIEIVRKRIEEELGVVRKMLKVAFIEVADAKTLKELEVVRIRWLGEQR